MPSRKLHRSVGVVELLLLCRLAFGSGVGLGVGVGLGGDDGIKVLNCATASTFSFIVAALLELLLPVAV